MAPLGHRPDDVPHTGIGRQKPRQLTPHTNKCKAKCVEVNEVKVKPMCDNASIRITTRPE